MVKEYKFEKVSEPATFGQIATREMLNQKLFAEFLDWPRHTEIEFPIDSYCGIVIHSMVNLLRRLRVHFTLVKLNDHDFDFVSETHEKLGLYDRSVMPHYVTRINSFMERLELKSSDGYTLRCSAGATPLVFSLQFRATVSE